MEGCRKNLKEEDASLEAAVSLPKAVASFSAILHHFFLEMYHLNRIVISSLITKRF